METSAIHPKGILPISSDSVDLRNVLKLMGMQEVANNVFSIPTKKKKVNHIPA